MKVLAWVSGAAVCAAVGWISACSTPYPCTETGGELADDGTCVFPEDEDDAGTDATASSSSSSSASGGGASSSGGVVATDAGDASTPATDADATDAAGDASVNASTLVPLTIAPPSLTLRTGGMGKGFTIRNASATYAAADLTNNLLGTALQAAGVTTVSTCGAALAPGASCTLTVTPAASAIASTSFHIGGNNTVLGTVHVEVLPAPVIGDSLQGGIVVKVDASKESGLLITASFAASVWGSYQVVTGATSHTGGAANTALIVSVLGADSTYAVRTCAEYTNIANGVTHDDWYLPALDQVNAVTLHMGARGGPIAGYASTPHWTSTEDSVQYASIMQMDGGGGAYPKNVTLPFFCMRAFTL